MYFYVILQDLQPEGRLQLVLTDLRSRDQPDQHLPTSHQETLLKSFLKKYVKALIENIDARFKESSLYLIPSGFLICFRSLQKLMMASGTD